jgi:transglutaminase-like putative cysteine protease
MVVQAKGSYVPTGLSLIYGDLFMTTARRTLLQGAASLGALSLAPWTVASAQNTPAPSRTFSPQAGDWRTFEVTTRVDIAKANGITRVWLPVPSVNTSWQKSEASSFNSNGITRMRSDGLQGVQILYAEFAANIEKPYVEITSRVQTQSRAPIAQGQAMATAEDAGTLKYFTRATHLLPTDGIVKATAQKAIQGAKTDLEKVRAIYDWVVANAWREPKVRGCGEGDIKTMLETGNLGGKCADINALFVGLCRSVGIPARDVYGIRLVPSAFGYKELSGNPASLKGAQHCRAEAYVKGQGWMAMDPADVAKVMRLETAEWLKTTDHPVVKPVYNALFGGWEGNWMAFNTAHDLTLPQSKGDRIGFFMYPTAENDEGRFDSYAPDDFKYQISAKEIKA